MSQVTEWIAAVVDSPTGSMPILVWYEPSTDKVIDIRVTEPGLGNAHELFARATEDPKWGDPRTPARIRVADPVLARALRGRVGDVEVIEGDISEAREAVEALAQYVSQIEPEAEIDVEAWSRLFHAAAALYRARPWEAIPSDTWIGIECEQLGISTGAVSVVGQMGQSYGFVLCRTTEDAATWLDAADARDRGEQGQLPAEFFMVGYDSQDELSSEDLEVVAEHGWELAGPDAYPSVTVHGEGRETRTPTSDELVGLTAIIEALATLVTDEPEIAEAWDGEPVDWHGAPGGVAVRLVAPLEIPGPPVNPADATLDILGPDGRPDEELTDRYRAALMTRLAEREEIPDDVLAAAEMLVEFAARYHHVTFGTITVDELRALLLETVPAELAVEADEAGRIVAAARELMRLAGEELGATAAPAALAMLDSAFQLELAEELADPANFNMPKQLIMAGIAAGFDMSSEEGVADFVRAYASAHAQRSKPKKRTKKAKAKPKGKAKAKPKAKAKQPTKKKATKPRARRR